jgi:DNA-directed RNA polymerase specialized sigma24 family protein
LPHFALEPVGDLLPADFDPTADRTETLAALDEALVRLEQVAPRQSRVVECRFFGGMSVDDTAEALRVSPRSVKRDWSFARAWLQREMQRMVGDGGGRPWTRRGWRGWQTCSTGPLLCPTRSVQLLW